MPSRLHQLQEPATLRNTPMELFRHQKFLLLLVGVAVLLPRLIALDTFAVQDEWLWLNRGSLYARYVTERNWEILHQYPPFSLHPGATLLALTSPLVSLYGNVQGLDGSFESWPSTEQRGAAVLVRLGMGVTTSALLLGLLVALLHTQFFSARPLWAAASVVFLGWEPWVLAGSRIVHLDALLSLFLLFATALSAVAREQPQWKLSALAGSAWALAFMTKSPAVFFLPIVLFPFLLRPFRDWKQTLRDLGAWVLSAAITSVVVWPPMWFHPILRLHDIWKDMFSHVEVPEIYVWSDPHAPLFLALLSTIALAGVVLYILARAWTLLRRQWNLSLLSTDLFLLGGLLFGILLFIAGGDHVRKNLPALAFLSFPGALGWLWLADRVRSIPWVAIGGLLALQAAVVFPWFPHVPSYHNPLLHSGEGKRLLVDIGNGTRLVADYFNTHPPAVFATNLPGLIQPYLTEDRRGSVRRLPKSGNLEELPNEVEYLVIPESFPARVLFDRGAAETLRQLNTRQPETVLRVRDVPLFSIVRAR